MQDLLLQLRPKSVLEPGGAYAELTELVPGAAGTSTAQPRATPPHQKLKDSRQGGESGATGKVTAVCQAMREAMRQLDEVKYVKPMCVSYVKREPRDLKGALEVVRKLKEQELAGAGLGISSEGGSEVRGGGGT